MLRLWALPITGVNATPYFYTEAEYYAAPVDEVRTYPFYIKSREPKGYRQWLRRQGPQPIIDPAQLETETDWIAAGREVFDGMVLPDFRTDDPRALAWANDPDLVAHEHVTITREGMIPGVRWLVDHDGKLKMGLAECSGCHSRVLDDGTLVRGAQTNVWRGSFPEFCFDHSTALNKTLGLARPQNEAAFADYGVPWLPDDINARLKTMTPEEIDRVDPQPPLLGTFVRVNASPWFTTKIQDLNGVKDRKYLDATATHRNRGSEDIARYAILVTVADAGSIGPYTFMSEERRIRRLTSRSSDEAMLALGKFIYSLEPPPSPNPKNELSARGEVVFQREGCGSCHTPPLYTNNNLVPVEGFTQFDHQAAPPASDIFRLTIGLDPGLALRTRKGTGYYKVPTLRGVWYRGLLEHSGSVATLEDWFDPKRLDADYMPTGWNPPGVKRRAVPGHKFGLQLTAEDKRALIAFLRTL
jgi:hypothetical protein